MNRKLVEYATKNTQFICDVISEFENLYNNFLFDENKTDKDFLNETNDLNGEFLSKFEKYVFDKNQTLRDYNFLDKHKYEQDFDDFVAMKKFELQSKSEEKLNWKKEQNSEDCLDNMINYIMDHEDFMDDWLEYMENQYSSFLEKTGIMKERLANQENLFNDEYFAFLKKESDDYKDLEHLDKDMVEDLVNNFISIKLDELEDYKMHDATPEKIEKEMMEYENVERNFI